MAEAQSGGIAIETFPVQPASSDVDSKVINPDEAREAIMAAVRSIPVEKLKNFRTGQITIVK